MKLFSRLFEHPEFTTLDRLLVSAAVDARKGTIGALNENEIDDAVDELIKLNGRRPRSYFQAGLRDPLFGREPVRELCVEDAESRRWYWAGATLGWARSESWDCITEAYDGSQTVRQLGDGSDTASSVAVEHIVQALHLRSRAAELSAFVRESAIVRSIPPLELYRLLLRIGTELQRRGDSDVARAVLDLLIRAEDGLRRNDFPPNEAPFLEARRRKAHCLRQLREHQAARELLLGLLEIDSDPNIHAMVQGDLGLLEGRFTLLADVQLPNTSGEEVADLRERLRAGELHFRAAVEREVQYAAHGHYVLGVLALAEAKYEEAAVALERSRTHFRSRPKNYPDALIACTDLYLGIAKVQILDTGELHLGAALITAGLRAGARFPTYMIEPTVQVLALDETCIVEVAGSLLNSGDNVALDALVTTNALNVCPELTAKLLERACRQDRGGEAAAADLRNALQGCLRTGDSETASEILDKLETLATTKGVGGEEFVELLLEPEHYEPAWNREDAAVARARYHESQGEFLEAMEALRPLFFQYMAEAQRDDEFALDNAVGLLSTVQKYGLDTLHFQDLESRYKAVAEELDDHRRHATPEAREAKVVKVLVVGGNERQARTDKEGVLRNIHERDKFVSVEFVHTGWTPNWSMYADQIVRLMGTHQALVIMRFMRTHLGRRIRKECSRRSIPWRFCWGGGRRAIVEAALNAARAARTGTSQAQS